MPTLISNKRHISPELEQFGARPILWDQEKQQDAVAASAAWMTTTPSINSNNSSNAKPLVVGLSIHGFEITTLQGPIADEAWDKRTTDILEEMAQYRPSTEDGDPRPPRRKISLPEMVHPMALVKIQKTNPEGQEDGDPQVQFQWNAVDALTEWAQAHADIPTEEEEEEDSSNRSPGQSRDQGSENNKASKVLTILKTKDAQLWKDKRQLLIKQQKDTSTTTQQEGMPDAVLHYDWSFSTPYVGSTSANSEVAWRSLSTSGLNMALLTDRSVPILYFDDITLMEDDLHDNGQVQYSVKIRVMPTCAFVLTRLWLRVDHVLVRCRETRFLMDFTTTTTTTGQGDPIVLPSIHRDVSWRECAWDKLAQHHLPSDLRTWQHLDQGVETPEWQSVLKRIPSVPPVGFDEHARFGGAE